MKPNTRRTRALKQRDGEHMCWWMTTLAMASGPAIGEAFPTHDAIELGGHPYTVIELTRSVDW
jgi:hypothetical protein